MKLSQFFVKKELYNQKNLTNYFHNLKVMEQIIKDKNLEKYKYFANHFIEFCQKNG